MSDEHFGEHLKTLSVEELLELSRRSGGAVRLDTGIFRLVAAEYDRREITLFP